MKILLLGKNGQVGWELQRALAPLGELIALDRQFTAHGLTGDLSNLAGLKATIFTIKPDIIVNAAAYTSVDKAQAEVVLARAINALACQVMAEAATELGAWYVHYSTDYVFDGTGCEPWQETDSTQPINIYGSTKLEGEHFIQASGCQHLIFRTSWVYAARGQNFAKTMLRLAQERDSLHVIDDQIGAPTGAELIADVTAHALRIALVKPEVSGIYHLVASGETSWHCYAQVVLDSARACEVDILVESSAVHPIATKAYPTPAKRPHNSRMNTTKLTSTFNVVLPAWEVGVKRMVMELF